MTAGSSAPDHLAWFRNARVGMFIHWGPVSLRGTEIGWSRGDGVPVVEYDQLYKQFNPTKFNADEWMNLAKRAGFRYVVPTAKHHDGFCLWPTKASDYNIMSTPFHRDIMGEIAHAAKHYGITMCSYFSILDWHSPDYGTGSPGGRGHKPSPNMDRHMETVKTEVSELVKNYGIRMIWFVGQWEAPYTREYSIDLNHYLRQLSPGLIINDRINSTKLLPDDPKGDYRTPEQEVGSYDTSSPWETCMTLGDQWAYRPHDHYKTIPQILKVLVQTVTGDGNLLLNVGPDETGQIVNEQKELLLGLGSWLGKYGVSVYGTRGGPYRNGNWGGTTRKGKSVYFHVLDWGNGEIRLPSLPAKILRYGVLQPGVRVACSSDHDGLTLKLSSPTPSEPTTVKVDLDQDAWSLGTINPMK
jgi:alpha-L-fucosidase